MSNMPIYDGHQWQQRVLGWLRLRYATGGFEVVPDEHIGDFGIEGFSRDGIAYQCHAHREPLNAKELYERQRVKMHSDILKFINNHKELTKLFGDLKIKSWWFVVPEHKSALLTQYSEKKVQEVKKANLPYVDDEFFIHIATADDFAVERATTFMSGLDQLRLDGGTVETEKVGDWATENEKTVKVIDDKLKRLLQTSDSSTIIRFRNELLSLYLTGKNKLDDLRKKSADLWEKVIGYKNDRKNDLAMECMTGDGSPKESLKELRKGFREDLKKRIPGLHESTTNDIAYGLEGDWWIECPLDFPESK